MKKSTSFNNKTRNTRESSLPTESKPSIINALFATATRTKNESLHMQNVSIDNKQFIPMKESYSPGPTTKVEMHTKVIIQENTNNNSKAMVKVNNRPSMELQWNERKSKRVNGNSTNSSGKKRKRTSTLRREEKEQLEKECMQLEAYADTLKRMAGMPSTRDEHLLANAQELSSKLSQIMEIQQFNVASLHSLLYQQVRLMPWNPLARMVKLPIIPMDRQRYISEMKESVLSLHQKYSKARFLHLDESKTYNTQELVTDDKGNVCLTECDVTQWKGPNINIDTMFKSLRNFINYVELDLTTDFGHLTLREDYDVVDPTGETLYYGLLSTENGIRLKSTHLAFGRRFLQEGQPSPNDWAIYASVPVDEDPLHPMNINNELLVEVTRVVTISYLPTENNEFPNTVVMKYCAFSKLTPPAGMSENTLDNIVRILICVSRMMKANMRNSLAS